MITSDFEHVYVVVMEIMFLKIHLIVPYKSRVQVHSLTHHYPDCSLELLSLVTMLYSQSTLSQQQDGVCL
jgi:hypothetical protein